MSPVFLNGLKHDVKQQKRCVFVDVLMGFVLRERVIKIGFLSLNLNTFVRLLHGLVKSFLQVKLCGRLVVIFMGEAINTKK